MPAARPMLLSECARRAPCQERGQERVEGLLAAAVREFARVGYEAATMTSIARRARSPIGSLYQFFPNKESVARTLRVRQMEDVEARLAHVERTMPRSTAQLADRLVDEFIDFVDRRPAYLPLQDAPSSTLPAGPRDRIRRTIASLLRRAHAALTPTRAVRAAETIMQLSRAMLGLYARSPRAERTWVIAEYRALMTGCLDRALGVVGPARRSAADPSPRRDGSSR